MAQVAFNQRESDDANGIEVVKNIGYDLKFEYLCSFRVIKGHLVVISAQVNRSALQAEAQNSYVPIIPRVGWVTISARSFGDSQVRASCNEKSDFGYDTLLAR